MYFEATLYTYKFRIVKSFESTLLSSCGKFISGTFVFCLFLHQLSFGICLMHLVSSFSSHLSVEATAAVLR